jgi:S-adenosylmethionine:tRNA ribosyltransferase-isomerase
MLVSDFDFNLPDELIAQQPLEKRDSSRMLVVTNPLNDAHIHDFIKFLKPGDVVVFNNSKVIACRFEADGYEFTLHTRQDNFWWAFAKKFNKLNIGDTLTLSDGTQIVIRDKNDESGVLIEFLCDDVFGVLEKVGHMPLPPYIKHSATESDATRYQTVYANPLGSMAAPTAGLHFTPELLNEIKNAGAQIVNITLHVGSGTWKPITVSDTTNHKMHSEWGVIKAEQADIINAATRVIAIGTTSLRLMESANGTNTRVRPFCGTTDIFITPGYKFHAVDVLLTNFHLPKSTLFMLVCAFAGTDIIKSAYQHAIDEKYRFFSYGDCCLLYRK